MPGPDFDLLAAGIRADAGDLHTFLDVLAAKLSDALPGQVQVEREGGLFAKQHPVRAIHVTVGGHRFDFGWLNGQLTAAQDGRPAGVDACIEELARGVAEQAHAGGSAREAMDSLLSGQMPAETIARPAPATGQLDYLWPRAKIYPTAEILVDTDEVAVVLTADGAHGPLAPGRRPLSPLFAEGVDQIEAEIHFVASRERPGLKFGGMVDKVLDPETGLAVGLRVFGDYSLQVVDAKAFVEKLVAGQGLTADQALKDWVRDLLLKVLRTDVAGHIGAKGWPILGIAAHTDAIERETLKKAQVTLAGYGVEIVRMGNFVISMKEEDEALLTAHRARRAEAAVSAPPSLTCPACGHSNPQGSRFCGGCGKPLSVHCSACGTENPAGTAFCTACGKPL